MPNSMVRRVLWIARRDYLAVVRTKAFLIGLVVFPILFGGGGLASVLLRGKGGDPNREIAVIDRTGAASAAVLEAARQKNQDEMVDKDTGLQVTPRYEFESIAADNTRPEEQRLALSDRVRRGTLHAFIEIPPDALHPPAKPPVAISYYAGTSADPAGPGCPRSTCG